MEQTNEEIASRYDFETEEDFGFPDCVSEDSPDLYRPDHAHHLSAVSDDTLSPEKDKASLLSELRPKYEASGMTMFQSGGRHQIVIRAIASFDSTKKKYIVDTFFPAVRSKKAAGIFRLEEIMEFGCGKEAILTLSIGDMTLMAYDVNYILHRRGYRIGESYPFALAAICYYAEPSPHGTPQLVSSGSRYPDDADFTAPVMSTPRKTSFRHHDYLVMDIGIGKADGAEIAIPMAVSESCFVRKPRKNTLIRGRLWLQAKFLDK